MGTINGTVRSSTGAPVPNATAMIVGDSPAHADLAALSDEAGAFRLTNLTPGTYSVLVQTEDGRSQTRSVQVPASGAASLEFRLA